MNVWILLIVLLFIVNFSIFNIKRYFNVLLISSTNRNQVDDFPSRNAHFLFFLYWFYDSTLYISLLLLQYLLSPCSFITAIMIKYQSMPFHSRPIFVDGCSPLPFPSYSHYITCFRWQTFSFLFFVFFSCWWKKNNINFNDSFHKIWALILGAFRLFELKI